MKLIEALLLAASIICSGAPGEGRIDLDHAVGWLPEMVPRSIVVFADCDGDRLPDEAWVLPVVAMEADCRTRDTVPRGMRLFSTCPAAMGWRYWTRDIGWRCMECLPIPAWRAFEVGRGRMYGEGE